jgi:signal transduction histidine kinase
VTASLTTINGFGIAEIRDTGIGIGEADLPHFFERFYRADKARPRELGGAGLGLSIGRWIAEAHGGSVEVESFVGQGSVFRVRLAFSKS